ncbi:MAG: radical SAM protein [Candidatus Anammoxibacter sp.]
MKYIPHAISWNITKKCNLHCAHCYIDSSEQTKIESSADATINPTNNLELSTDECLNIIDQIAEVNPRIIIILTGGEPLLREDIFDLIKYAKDKGMTVFLGSNGCLFNDKVIENLKASGITGVGISLDSLNTNIHDSFRGTKGAWDGAVKAALMCKESNIGFQIQTTVTNKNINEIPDIIKFANDIGASAFQLFFLVCTGRGQGLTDITPAQYEDTLTKLYETQKKFTGSMLVGAKCAPHYKRIVFNLDQDSPLLKAYAGGCPAGTNYCRINSEGKVTACPYMETIAGDLKKESFSKIWSDSTSLGELRELNLKGKCAKCEFKSICKGCRARALATNNDQMSEDPWCLYKPDPANNKDKIDIKLREEDIFGMKAEFNLEWTDEAKERLEKVPSFIRGMAIRGAEKYAKENDLNKVTPEVMKAARENMGDENKSMFPLGKMPKNMAKDDEEDTKNPEGADSESEEKLHYFKEGEVPWTETAKKRVENAPSFVRPGIYKLMQKRSNEEGEKVITTEFLSKIRNESMFLAAGRLKKFGFDDLKMEVFDAAKGKINNEKKRVVIDEIKGFLGKRTKKNDKIISLFEEYMKPNDLDE